MSRKYASYTAENQNSARGNLFGQLVVLGCDVTVSTPAPYQRHRL